jgi:membrane protease YdiL (CAAX protease family)
MKPEDLPPDQLALLALFSIVLLAMFLGMIFVHAWLLLRWNKVAFWDGWKRDSKPERIGFIDLVAFAGCVIMAQVLVVGLVGAKQEEKIYVPSVERATPFPVSPVEGPVASIVTKFHGTNNARQDSNIPVAATYGIGKDDIGKDDIGKDGLGSGGKGASELSTPSAWNAFAMSCAFIIAAAGSVFLVQHRTGGSAWRLGMVSNELAKDVWVGLLVFLWATPIVLVVSSLVGQWTQVEYEHPVIDALKEDPMTFPLLFFSAGIAAPLWEEYAFRFLLIGWIDTIRQFLGSMDFRNFFVLLTGNPVGKFANELVHDQEPSLVWTQVAGDRDVGVASNNAPEYPPFWVALASGTLFGLAHFEYGVSWVPLIVLGTIMARVYQLRRSVVPCIVIHALFNSMSLMGLAGGLILKDFAPEAGFLWYFCG